MPQLIIKMSYQVPRRRLLLYFTHRLNSKVRKVKNSQSLLAVTFVLFLFCFFTWCKESVWCLPNKIKASKYCFPDTISHDLTKYSICFDSLRKTPYFHSTSTPGTVFWQQGRIIFPLNNINHNYFILPISLKKETYEAWKYCLWKFEKLLLEFYDLSMTLYFALSMGYLFLETIELSKL